MSQSTTQLHATTPWTPSRRSERSGGALYNAAAVLRSGKVAHVYRKQALPNFTVFDEARYFAPGTSPCVFDAAGVAVRGDVTR